MCDNFPCISNVEGKLFADADMSAKDITNILQRLSEEFIDGYKILKHHDAYLPGDDEVIDVNVPMCIYTQFHKWSKNLL